MRYVLNIVKMVTYLINVLFFISVNQHFPAKGYFVNFCDLKLLVTIEFREAQFLSPLI